MKKCPVCAEEIQDEAIKCRYCGEMLKKESPETVEFRGISREEAIKRWRANPDDKRTWGDIAWAWKEANKDLLPRATQTDVDSNNNGAAIASFILGILAIITGIFGLGLFFGVIAVSLGRQGRDSKHSALVNWGIWLGYWAIGCSILAILFWILFYGIGIFGTMMKS